MGLKRMDDRGQSNIDFLFGLGIFLATFIYAVSFIPGLFVPYQPSSIDLSSVAYRTGVILVEDPGWYIYDGTNGYGLPQWETNIADLKDSTKGGRIGLADNSLDKSTPNVLSIDKIKALNDPILIPYTVARDKMGLSGSVIYDFNLNITMNNTLTHQNQVILDRKSDQTVGGGNIEYMDRAVLIDTGKELVVDCQNPYDQLRDPGGAQYLYVNLTDMTSQQRQNDLTLRIYNSSAAGQVTIQDIDQVTSYPAISISVAPTDYSITINGVPTDLAHAVFKATDVVDITIKSNALQNPAVTHILIKTGTNGVFPRQVIDYENDPYYSQESICYPGILKLEVWTGGLAP